MGFWSKVSSMLEDNPDCQIIENRNLSAGRTFRGQLTPCPTHRALWRNAEQDWRETMARFRAPKENTNRVQILLSVFDFMYEEESDLCQSYPRGEPPPAYPDQEESQLPPAYAEFILGRVFIREG